MQNRLPPLIELRQLAEHGERGSTSTLSVIGLLAGGAPHGHQFIADVIDQHALLFQHALGENVENIVDPFDRPRGSELLADPAETSDVTEEHRNLAIASLEQLGPCGKLAG